MMFFSIIILLITKINSLLSFEYPTAVYLINGNIFVIEKNGIFICDPTFTDIIKVEVNFTNDDQKIKNETALSKVVIKEYSKNIFALINNIFYVFDTQGQLLFNDSNIIKNGENPEYYTLNVFKIDSHPKSYRYIIGFFDSNIHLNLFYYKYNMETNTNTFIKYINDTQLKAWEYNYNFKRYISKYYYFINKALTCELLNYNNKGIFVCFFIIKDIIHNRLYQQDNYYYYLTQGYYIVETAMGKDRISNYYDILNHFIEVDNNFINFIKSEANHNLQFALICFVYNNNYLYSLKFEIYYGSGYFFSKIYLPFQCRNEFYGINVKYLRETLEVVSSCSNQKGEIASIFYDKNMRSDRYYYIRFLGCDSVYGYSVLYLSNHTDYYIISDVICQNKSYPFKSFYNNDFTQYDSFNNKINEEIIEIEIEEKIIEEEYTEEYFESGKEENEEISFDEQDSEEEYNVEISYNNIDYNKSSESCPVDEFLYKKCTFNNDNLTLIQNFILNISNNLKDNSLYEMLNNITNKNKEDIILYENNIIYEITSSYNQNNKEYENISTIDLGECENILKKQYNIDENETLLIFKIDYFLEGLKTPFIKYEIFHPKTKESLDMKYCKDYTIKMNIPVTIDEDEVFKYDPSSDYYNDKCFLYTSEHGTDMTLYDRKNEFNKNNMSLCTIGCEFDGYNSKTKKAICECQVESNITLSLFLQSIINNENIIHKFIDIKETANLGVIECYKLLFKKEGLIKNIGSYILIFIILIFIVSCFIFYFKDSEYIRNTIANVIKINKENCKIKKNFNGKKTIKKKNIINDNLDSKKFKKRKKAKKAKKKKKTKKKSNLEASEEPMNNVLNNQKLFENKNMMITDNYYNENQNNNISQKFTDYELNSMIYKKALINDKRTYVLYYFSLLRTKHLIIFCFYPINDYNSKVIKVILFFFSFALYYIINALFFNDSTMHKIYENFGIYNIIYQINKISYSLIISSAIIEIIKYFSLSQKNIIMIKNEEDIENLDKIGENELKCIYKKIFIFYFISFLFLFFFWFYIGCFCAVYINTQIFLIKDTLISFGMSLLYPIFINLIPGILRIPALKNNNSEIMYNLSKIIQIF